MDTIDTIQRFLYLFGVWEPNLTAWIRTRLRPGDTFVDVGAHHGYYAALASQLVGGMGRVVAIEPIDDFLRSMEDVLELNGCENVRTVQQAVSDKDEELSLWLGGEENLGNTSILQDEVTRMYYTSHQTSTATVKAAPLPELLSDDELERARLIKIDVEGAEVSVIKGLSDSLDRLSSDAEIIVEVAPHLIAQAGQRLEDLVDPLVAAGFKVYRIANDYDPASYPRDIRRPRRPMRWNEPIAEQMDLVFSRSDLEHL